MRWQGRARSTNVEDRRGMPGGGLAVGGGFGTLAIIVVALLLGVNPMQFLQQGGPPPGAVADRGGVIFAKDKVIVQSFFPTSLEAVKRLDPELATQFLTLSETGRAVGQQVADLAGQA